MNDVESATGKGVLYVGHSKNETSKRKIPLNGAARDAVTLSDGSNIRFTVTLPPLGSIPAGSRLDSPTGTAWTISRVPAN